MTKLALGPKPLFLNFPARRLVRTLPRDALPEPTGAVLTWASVDLTPCSREALVVEYWPLE